MRAPSKGPKISSIMKTTDTKQQPQKEQPEAHHPFKEMLSVMSVEDLIRFKVRLQKKGKKGVIALLNQEIERKTDNGEE